MKAPFGQVNVVWQACEFVMFNQLFIAEKEKHEIILRMLRRKINHKSDAVMQTGKEIQEMRELSGLEGLYLEDLEVGMVGSYAKTVTETDIVMYAGLSGDTNPVHLNQEYAKTTMFEGRIAHGMLSAGFISTVLGTRLPGPGTIYLSQSLQFKVPVRIGDTVTARVTVLDIIAAKKRVVLETNCYVGDQCVISGEAMVMVPSRAAS